MGFPDGKKAGAEEPEGRSVWPEGAGQGSQGKSAQSPGFSASRPEPARKTRTRGAALGLAWQMPLGT